MAEVKTNSEMRDHLISKASTDAEFRARLLSDPKTVISDELGVTIPDGFTISVHEEDGDRAHLVLPPAAELGEAELRQAAGGGDDSYGWDPYQ